MVLLLLLLTHWKLHLLGDDGMMVIPLLMIVTVDDAVITVRECCCWWPVVANIVVEICWWWCGLYCLFACLSRCLFIHWCYALLIDGSDTLPRWWWCLRTLLIVVIDTDDVLLWCWRWWLLLLHWRYLTDLFVAWYDALMEIDDDDEFTLLIRWCCWYDDADCYGWYLDARYYCGTPPP
jgi:hypothetical protein